MHLLVGGADMRQIERLRFAPGTLEVSPRLEHLTYVGSDCSSEGAY